MRSPTIRGNDSKNEKNEEGFFCLITCEIKARMLLERQGLKGIDRLNVVFESRNRSKGWIYD
jgi:hypothetical protein